jgi:hypothetical protein
VLGTSDPSLFWLTHLVLKAAGCLPQRSAMGEPIVIRDHAPVCQRQRDGGLHAGSAALELVHDANTSNWWARVAQVEFAIAGARAVVRCDEHGATASDPGDGRGVR